MMKSPHAHSDGRWFCNSCKNADVCFSCVPNPAVGAGVGVGVNVVRRPSSLFACGKCGLPMEVGGFVVPQQPNVHGCDGGTHTTLYVHIYQCPSHDDTV